MRHYFKLLTNRIAGDDASKQFVVAHPQHAQVTVPAAVTLPFPKTIRDEISVPASINGRDLSTGRL